MELTQPTLAASHQLAHALFSMVTADLTAALADRELPGACISRISPIMAHAAFGEDLTVNRTLRAAATVFERDGWAARTGIPGPIPAMTPEWLAAAFDIGGLKAYAAAVFESTDRFLASAQESELKRMASSPLGTEVTGAELLSSFNLLHLMLHTGEIAALKGAQGVPGGLPF